MDRRRFVTAVILVGAGCTSPEDDDGGDDEETGGGAYGKVDAPSRPLAP